VRNDPIGYSDIPGQGGNVVIGSISHPGASEDQLIQDLIDATDFYNRSGRVDYDILPGALPGAGSNSTGGLSGSNTATDAVIPDLAGLDLWTAGSNDLVAPRNFGPISREDAESIPFLPSTTHPPVSAAPYCKGC